MKIKFLGIGWKSKLLLKRATFFISINKLVATGCLLEKGKKVYSYLAEDDHGKKVIVTYLTGKRRNEDSEILENA